MKSEKIRFLQDHPILAMLLSMVLIQLYFLAVGVIQNIVAMLLTGGSQVSSIVDAVVTIASSLLLLWLYQRKYYPNGRKFFSTQGFGPSLLYGWGLLVVAVLSFSIARLTGTPMGNVFAAIILGIAPGIQEELLCRTIPISLLMKREDRRNLVPAVYIIPSLLFGLFHFVNLFSGADLILTLLQVAYATAVGLILASIYLKTGNLWITIALHSFMDFVAYLSLNMQQSDGILKASGSYEWVGYLVQLLYTVIFAINAFWLYRKSSREEIAQTWEEVNTDITTPEI